MCVAVMLTVHRYTLSVAEMVRRAVFCWCDMVGCGRRRGTAGSVRGEAGVLCSGKCHRS